MKILIAYGPNSIEIPCMIVDSVEEFLKRFPYLIIDKSGCIHSKHNEDLSEEEVQPFFLSYYDGCGGVDYFKILEVEPYKPFIQWDLD